MLRHFVCGIIMVFVGGIFAGCASTSRQTITEEQSSSTLTFRKGDARVVTYNIKPPVNSGLPVESGDYFHPFTTPAGEVLTDFTPTDHKHHRGVFLAWVEMHGEKDADFWGWGEHAPIKQRRVEVVEIDEIKTKSDRASFVANCEWRAEGTVLMNEELKSELSISPQGNVLDLTYTFVPLSNITLSQWAFSGFCLRTKKEGEVAYYSPKGPASYPNPSHLKPESDWPDESWYAAQLKMPNGKVMGGAVINHPSNPKTMWHNHRDIRMINPCIVAPQAVRLKKGVPLTLRYRVVAFDGPVPTKFLNELAGKWK
jgi:hypothetical protein